MNREELKKLLEKYSQNTLSPKEKKQLLGIMESQEHRDLVKSELYTEWNRRDQEAPFFQKSRVLKELHARLDMEQPGGKYLRADKKSAILIPLLKYAAVFLVAVAATSLVYFNLQPGTAYEKESRENRVEINYGSKGLVHLPDGSKVWLNAGSTISYPDHFSSESREITLSGEAFFDVTHRKGSPFIVQTDNLDIRVLGTRFNVKCYEDEQTIETTLVSGKVELLNKDDHSRVEAKLEKNQKAIYYKEDRHMQVEKTGDPGRKEGERRARVKPGQDRPLEVKTLAEPSVETSWKDGILKFNASDFEELARQMERWFDVKIHFHDPAAKTIKYTGAFDKETLEQAMEALSMSFPIEYTIDKNEVHITGTDRNGTPY